MRADLLHARAERDAAHREAEDARRSSRNLAGEVAGLRRDNDGLRASTARLETELRSARSLAERLSSSKGNGDDLHRAAELESRAKDLESRLEAATARLAERTEEVRELRRYRDQHLSQQRLEALRATAATTKDNNKNNNNGGKKQQRPRYSIKLAPLK